jgi:catechol 2,3-dioxygenase-like lactoylglutathione lyase family enzyme
MFDVWHLGLPVEDLERSVSFYVDGLGFELLGYSESERYRMAFARVPGGAFTIEFLQYRERTAAKRPDHLAFEAPNVDAFRARLLQEGYFKTLPAIADAGPGLRRFAVTDPDGVPIQFYEGRANFDKTALRRTEAHHV